MINSTKILNHSGWECKHYDCSDLKIQETTRIASLFPEMSRRDHLVMEPVLIWFHSFVEFALSLRKKDTSSIEIALSYTLFQ